MANILDPVTNFAIGTLASGIDIDDTEFSVGAGEGAKFPAPSTEGAFNVVIFNSTDYRTPSDDPNKEILRVTAISTDALTVTRAQEGTSAATHNTGGKVYKIILAPTKKQRDDIETELGKVLLSAYPVGAVYISVVDTSPATLFGGTWAAFATGRTLVGIDAGDTDFDTVEETIGAKTVSIAHTHAGPSHTHTHSGTTSTYTANVPTGGSSGTNKGGTHNHTWSGTTDAGGTGDTGAMSANGTPSVIQPSIVVYMWKRTA